MIYTNHIKAKKSSIDQINFCTFSKRRISFIQFCIFNFYFKQKFDGITNLWPVTNIHCCLSEMQLTAKILH